MTFPAEPPDVGLHAQLACIWEATARKAGNVHRTRDFTGLTYLDFVTSAAASAPVFARARQQRVGTTILEAVRATRRLVATNTNLGIVLLLAPLAAVPDGEDLRSGVENVLAGLDRADSRDAYAAIRLACPGGLGRVDAEDVRNEPSLPLRAAMALAQDRDMVARQYADGFRAVLDVGVPAFTQALERWQNVEDAIVHTQLALLQQFPDSLIARKCGSADAAEASLRAGGVLEAGWPDSAEGRRAFSAFDAWLRGHARNPGTSADLVTACLFVALRQGTIMLPLAVAFFSERLNASEEASDAS